TLTCLSVASQYITERGISNLPPNLRELALNSCNFSGCCSLQNIVFPSHLVELDLSDQQYLSGHVLSRIPTAHLTCLHLRSTNLRDGAVSKIPNANILHTVDIGNNHDLRNDSVKSL